MRPHIDDMRANIARALKIDIEQVNVKATTEEGMGFTGEGNGNPLQYSCLVNPRDSRAWWAAVYGVAQSWT